MTALFIVGFIYSRFGQRSGAHRNPAVTLAFFHLVRIDPWDAAGYVIAQILGGIVGVGLGVAVIGDWLADPAVNYVAPVPTAGILIAFLAEEVVGFLAMTIVLVLANDAKFTRFTEIASGLLLAVFVLIAAPYSGGSFNPARGLAIAIPSGLWQHLWIYLLAPPLGTLAAAAARRRLSGNDATYCAKISHPATGTCHFCCHFAELMAKKP